MGACNICGEQSNTIFSVDRVPPIQNRFFSNTIEAQNFDATKVVFFWCDNCQHVSIHKEKSLDFDEQYNNNQAASSVAVNQFRAVFNDIEQMVPAKSSRIIEIGCGRGELLKMLQDIGYGNLKGYDPAAPAPSELVSNDYWNGEESEKADLVIARHTLEEIPDPKKFIATIAGAIKQGGYFYAEITNATHLIGVEECFSLYPEYCNIFSLLSLAGILSKSGFLIKSANAINGGEWLGVWAKKQDYLLSNRSVELNELSRKIKKLPKPLVLWGAAGRGGNILAFLHLDLSEMEYVVDINVDKQGKFVPPFGQKIISLDELKKLEPKTILVANSKYKKEILAQVPTNYNVLTLGEI